MASLKIYLKELLDIFKKVLKLNVTKTEEVTVIDSEKYFDASGETEKNIYEVIVAHASLSGADKSSAELNSILYYAMLRLSGNTSSKQNYIN